MPTAEEIAQVGQLLKEGRIQEASDLNARILADAAKAEAEAAGRPLEAPPPRPQLEVLRDILGQIAHDLGNRPNLELLLHEYDEVAK